MDLDLKIDQIFIIVLPFNSIFLKEFPDKFCSSVVLLVSTGPQFAPLISKKSCLPIMTCFPMDLKTDQTLILVLSLSSSFFMVLFNMFGFLVPLPVSTLPHSALNSPKKNFLPKESRAFSMDLKTDQTLFKHSFDVHLFQRCFSINFAFWRTCWFPLIFNFRHKRYVRRRNDVLF